MKGLKIIDKTNYDIDILPLLRDERSYTIIVHRLRNYKKLQDVTNFTF